MASNKSLHAAKKTKKDEFYTRREDIENELTHYADHFKDKVVYCNCDDPVTSEFWQFFMRNFRPWGLKKLIATHYEPDEKNYAYMLEISEDTNGDGVVDWRDEPTVTQIPCNGDFRSAACIELLKQADIVVTNPPFSLFREYVAQLMEYEKKFVIIGHQNAIKYKEVFPYLRDNKIWLGYGFPGNVGFFYAPNYVDYAVSSQHIDGCIRVSGVVWFTNLDIPKRHEKIDLRGNYYRKGHFPHYINFDAIDVSKVNEIPCDYDGCIGVPITFLADYNPDQFELVGIAESSLGIEIGFSANLTDKECTSLFHENKSFRRGNPIYRGDDGKLHKPFARIIIRLREPEPRRYSDED